MTKKAAKNKKARANETPGQTEARQATDAQSHRDARANETPEQTETRLAANA